MAVNAAATNISCGVRQVNGLRKDSHAVLMEIAFNQYDQGQTRTAFVIWSDHAGVSSGALLTDYIRKNSLGNVVASTPALNPNSTHEIQVWTWALPHDKLLKWYRAEQQKVTAAAAAAAKPTKV